jgi:hypothetical protein
LNPEAEIQEPKEIHHTQLISIHPKAEESEKGKALEKEKESPLEQV